MSDEIILYLQKLELNRLGFVRKLTEPLEIEEPTTFRITGNDTAEFRTMDGQELLADVKWDFLGRYGSTGSTGTRYWWTWGWVLAPPEEGTRPDVIRKIVKEKLPEFAHDTFEVGDSMGISYVQSRLLDMMRYTYIHVEQSENSWSAFGIRDVKWAPYDADAHKAQLYYAALSGIQ